MGVIVEINIWIVIFLGLLSLFLQYVIIETAVRRGIDASQTHELLKELVKRKKEK